MMGKRYRRYRRRPLCRLLPFLMLAALCLCMFPAAAQDDSSDFVGSFDLQEIFQGNPLEISENDVLLCDPVQYPEANKVMPYSPNQYQHIQSVVSKREISFGASWKFSTSFTLKNGVHTGETTFKYGISEPGAELMIEASFIDQTGNMVLRIRKWNKTTTSVEKVYGRVTVPKEKVVDGSPLVLEYSAKAKTLTCTYNGISLSVAKADCSALQQQSARLGFNGLVTWQVTAAVPEAVVRAHFDEAKYTTYTPQFVETTILNSAGLPMSEDEKKQVRDGDIITVQAKVNNTFSDGDPVPVHLKLSDSTTYPTAMLNFDSTTWGSGQSQQVTVDGVVVPDINITGTGIPLPCKSGGTVVTYRAMVENPTNKAVTVGQMIEDDFFLSKQYSGTELAPAQPLVPYDPQDPAAGQPGSDYHYSRLPAANPNGWNNTPVEVTFYPGDFDTLIIQDEDDGQVVLQGSTTQQKYQQELEEKQLEFWAEDSNEGIISVKKSDQLRIDLTTPQLFFSGDTLTLTDNLSGVWKLQKKQSDGSFADWQVFDLTDGVAPLSQALSISQNGVYRAVDAAGNISVPSAFSPVDPPDVGRPDPDGTPPVGPVVDPSNPMPVPDSTVDADTGLKHTIITENIFEYIDEQTPLYGGRFTAAHAQALMDYRYSVTTDLPGGLTTSLTVIKDGVDVTAQGIDTTHPGSFTIRYVATDPQGNTTTILLTDTLVDRRKPPVVVYPDEKNPPVGPPIDPNKTLPAPVVTTDPDTGYRHALITDEVTETITRAPALYGGRIDRQTAQALLTGRFDIRSAQPDGTLSLLGLQILAADGRDITALGIDTTVPGDYLLRYTVADSQGNRTTVELTYHLVKNPNDPTGQITHTVDPFDGTDSGAGQNGSPVDTGLGGHGAAADCRLHWLALLASAATVGYTLLRRRRTSWLPDILFFGALAGLCAVLWPLSHCPLDHSSLLAYAGALLVCWAARLRALTAPAKSPENK